MGCKKFITEKSFDRKILYGNSGEAQWHCFLSLNPTENFINNVLFAVLYYWWNEFLQCEYDFIFINYLFQLLISSINFKNIFYAILWSYSMLSFVIKCRIVNITSCQLYSMYNLLIKNLISYYQRQCSTWYQF